MLQSQSKNKQLFFATFCFSLLAGFILLFSVLPSVEAATVDVSGEVAASGGGANCGDNTIDSGEECDGTSAGACWNNHCNSDCTCPDTACNGEAGEACSSNSDCSTGYTCNSNCQCQVAGGNPCIPGANICSTGPCVNGSQTISCNNGCSTSTSTQSCTVIECGNGITETGEECDDGNNLNGDGCSSTCQLEFGCGNGVIDNNEECDDNNLSSGDCCDSNCKIEVLISSVSETPTNNSGQIAWVTQCQVTSSDIEWGTNPAVKDGIASFNGQNFSHNITGLQESSTYFYKITASATIDTGKGQPKNRTTTYTGSFTTFGGVENCNNGLDDDGNGYCDYPASTCSDGSVAGDPACVCAQPGDFVCTPISSCDPDTLLEEVECVDQNGCEATYTATQSCGCPGITPGPCQQVDANTCTLVDVPLCCGNGTCEPPGEDPTLCAVDCPVSCISNWDCTAWSPEPCPANNIQTRDCFDLNGCTVPINPPAIVQSCGGSCPGLSCGVGQVININKCVCEDIIPFCGNGVCEVGENNVNCSADCIELCTPNWTCTEWSACNPDGSQIRNCQDLNNCNLNINRPPEVKSCAEGCDIACSTCQVLDVNSCSCLETALCCGNRACEDNESIWSCAVDCGIPPTFTITLTTCLDGRDNDGDGLFDYPQDPGCKNPFDNSELNLEEVIDNITGAIENVIDNPQVEEANQKVVAPTIVTIATASTVASFSLVNLLSYLQYIFTQPFAFIFRRKRKKWGVVYNSLTKQPIDLAIVRLYKKDNGQLVRSRVTDKEGRYSFLVDPGKYYMTVTKPKFDFPTAYLKEEKEDTKFVDLYHGGSVEVTEKDATITANIPVDPQVQEQSIQKVVFKHYLQKFRYAISFASVPLAAVSLVISPKPFTFALFGFHCLLFILFRRLGYQKKPKSWGVVYDQGSKRPLGRAITRIYDKKYNKLLETRVTDGRGRYSFLVNNNVYYVTAEKLGYNPHKTADIDLVNKNIDTVIGKDIDLNKLKAGEKAAALQQSAAKADLPEATPPPVGKVGMPAASKVKPPAQAQAPETISPKTSKPAVDDIAARVDKLDVDRSSLEDLIKSKQEVSDLKSTIDENQEVLEDLEDKVESFEEDIDKKISTLDKKQVQAGGKSIAQQLEDIKQGKVTSEEVAGQNQAADESQSSGDFDINDVPEDANKKSSRDMDTKEKPQDEGDKNIFG